MIPRISYGTLKYLFAVGYRNTTGVTISPYFTHSHGNENNMPKLRAISPVKKTPAYVSESSPVVNGLALVLSTCLSISRSKKSFIIHPADLVARAPTVNKLIIYNEGITVGDPSANPQ